MDTLKKIGYKSLYIVLLLAISACEKVVDRDYVMLSVSSFTFDADCNDPLQVDVVSSQDWTCSCKDAWITTEVNENGLTVNVQNNTGFDVRTGTVSITAGTMTAILEISQLPCRFDGELCDVDTQGAVMSRNGKYIAFVVVDGETNVVRVKDIETGDIDDLIETQCKKIVAISDDAQKIILSDETNTFYYNNGTVVSLEAPDGYSVVLSDMSSDGSILVGYGVSGVTYLPLRYVNGELDVLDMPENNMMFTPLRSGAMARGCSENGSVIYGSEWDTQGAVIWIDGEMKYAAMDLGIIKDVIINDPFTGEPIETKQIASMKLFGGNSRSSADGRYITGSYQGTIDTADGKKNLDCIALLDTQNYTLSYFECEGVENCSGTTVDNSGIIYAGTPSTGMFRGLVLDSNVGKSYTITEWFDIQGIRFPEDRIVTGIGANGTFIGIKPLEGASQPTYLTWYFRY